MAMTNNIVTISGNVGNDPSKGLTKAGLATLNFRVASSNGYWDRNTGAWAGEGTSWYAVSAFGKLAENARGSLRSGDAVVITGRIKIKAWESNGRSGEDVEIVADAIGHDLNKGTSAFVRRIKADARSEEAPLRSAPPQGEPVEEEGVPTEVREAWDDQGLVPPADNSGEDVGAAEPASALA